MSAEAALIEINNFARIFKAFGEAQNAIQELSSLAQNKKELEDKIQELKDELSGYESRKTLSQQEIDQLDVDFESIKAKKEVDLAIEIDGLRQEAINNIQAETASLLKTQEDLRSSVATLQGQASQLQEAIGGKQVALNDLTDKIAITQQTMQQLLNAASI